MQTNTRAMVLRTIKYGDSKLVVDMLTEAYGRLVFMQAIPHSRRSAANTRLLQPLSLLNVVFDYKPNAAMQRARELNIAHPFTSIYFDERKLAIALFVAEFSYYATHSEQQNVPLFRFVADSIEWLDTCKGSFANFHIIYMLQLSRFLGFFPNLDEASTGSYFDLRNGCFTPLLPYHDDYLRPVEAEKITLLMRLRYATMHLAKMSHGERNRCVEVIMRFYRLHIPNFPILRSLSVLQELFA